MTAPSSSVAAVTHRAVIAAVIDVLGEWPPPCDDLCDMRVCVLPRIGALQHTRTVCVHFQTTQSTEKRYSSFLKCVPSEVVVRGQTVIVNCQFPKANL